MIIPEYDRLGRADETQKELQYFKEHNIRVMFMDTPTTTRDISSLNDKMAQMIMECINGMLLQFCACLVRTELGQKEKRQREGIESMKKRGDR